MPVIALNFKTYAESTGERAVRLAKAAETVAEQVPEVDFIICPPFPSLGLVLSRMPAKGIEVFAQHADPNEQGAFTGSITLEELKAIGCAGTLLNHSEIRIPVPRIKETVARALKVGLKVMVCAKDVAEGVTVSKTRPWAVAVEPPELIGSGVSVSAAKPQVVEDAVKQIRKVNPRTLVIVGAGVTTPEDVGKCVELGAQGVLLASAFVKANDPEKLLKEMASAALQ